MRILITGSRDWDDWQTIEQEVFRVILEVYGSFPAVTEAEDFITIVEGGARGADEIACQFARKMLWNVERHPADWDKHGKRAGILRNLEMIEQGADVCLAFIKDNSRGATHCADAAEKAGIPVRRYRA